MAKLDGSKPLQTRDGKPARVICMDAKTIPINHPYIVLVTNGDVEHVRKYTVTGETALMYPASPTSLINVPEHVPTLEDLSKHGLNVKHYPGNSYAAWEVFKSKRSCFGSTLEDAISEWLKTYNA